MRIIFLRTSILIRIRALCRYINNFAHKTEIKRVIFNFRITISFTYFCLFRLIPISLLFEARFFIMSVGLTIITPAFWFITVCSFVTFCTTIKTCQSISLLVLTLTRTTRISYLHSLKVCLHNAAVLIAFIAFSCGSSFLVLLKWSQCCFELGKIFNLICGIHYHHKRFIRCW